MRKNGQITMIQAAAVLISSVIGVGVLPLPLFAVTAANTGAPLITLCAGLLSFVGVWLLTKLGMRFPKQTFVQYSATILGKWPSFAGALLIIAFFGLLTSLAAREFGEVVITSVLKKTPLEITVIVMLLLATLSSRNDLQTFVYVHHFYLPIIVFPVLLIVGLSMKNADWLQLLPLWGNEPKPGAMLHGVLTIAALFQGSFVYSLIVPAMRHPQRAMVSSMWGIGIASGIYFFIVVGAVGVFGSEETKELLWPTLELAKTTTLPGNILERLDAAFLAVWVTAVFTTLFSTYYFTVYSLGQLFGLRDHRALSIFVLPYLFAIAMLPQNVMHMYKIIAVVGRFGLLLTIGYPLLLFVIAKIRRKGGGSRGEASLAVPD